MKIGFSVDLFCLPCCPCVWVVGPRHAHAFPLFFLAFCALCLACVRLRPSIPLIFHCLYGLQMKQEFLRQVMAMTRTRLRGTEGELTNEQANNGVCAEK